MKKGSGFRVQGSALNKKAKKVKLLILDVDGVMTDGRIILDNTGNEIKSFHVRDGHGIKMAQKAGINVAIITGRKSRVVEHRAAELGINDVYQKVLSKVSTYEKIIRKYHLKDEDIAFVGDDINDLSILKRVGFSAAVADGDSYVKKEVDYITKTDGGRGAVREVVDVILRAQRKWDVIAKTDF
ncbi:MAG: 3-deoxy-manno-octulosonate-8-phosphatase KdsC [Nitrospirota bacterium]